MLTGRDNGLAQKKPTFYFQTISLAVSTHTHTHNTRDTLSNINDASIITQRRHKTTSISDDMASIAAKYSGAVTTHT